MKLKRRFLSLLVLCFCGFGHSVFGQETEFTYQGRLVDGSLAANGMYEMQFRLFDALADGTQQPQPVPITLEFTVAGSNPVTVSNGVFTVNLDFTSAAFPGAARFLEISVRQTDVDPYVVLDPRQPITSAPHNIRSLSSEFSDGLSVTCVLCVTDAHIQSIDGGKVAGTVASAANAINVTGVVQIANGGTGSSTKSFVDLSTNQTNIGGDKTFTGAVGVTGGSGVFSGNGSGLTNLNGANITNNTINTAALAPGAVLATHNMMLLGSLRWDLLKRRSFGVGSTTVRAAFDGTNIWVTNYTSDDVTKLRASDGVVQGTFAVGDGPLGVAFDGANIWVTNDFSFTVTKLRASDGACVSPCTFPAGMRPTGVAFDGANVWVTNVSGGTVTKLRASDGVILNTFPVGIAPNGVAFDGANIWVTNFTSDNVTKLRASDGVVQGTFAVGDGPHAVAFDGTNIWVTNGFSDNVTKLRASDGVLQDTLAVGDGPNGVAFDGANIWVVNRGSDNVTKLRASDGVVLGTFGVSADPTGIVFDGANIWVTDQASNSIVRLPAFP